jgi:hypothetical protein
MKRPTQAELVRTVRAMLSGLLLGGFLALVARRRRPGSPA